MLETLIREWFETFVQELSQLERLMFSIAVVIAGALLIVLIRKMNQAEIAAKADRKRADSLRPCDRCGRDKKSGLVLRSPYCQFCRITFSKRTLFTATIGALTVTGVVFILSVIGYLSEDSNWSDVALTGWLFCVLLYPVAAAMSPSRYPRVVWMSLTFPLIKFFMFWAPADGEPWVWHRELLESIICTLSICIALVIYWANHRRECRACGQRAALRQTEKKYIPEGIFEAGHDEALWQCQYCGHEFWRTVMSSYEGGGG
jgi:hypothetical protein